MNPRALQQARERLSGARKSLGALAEQTDLAAFRPFWTDFLLHSNNVFSKLEQGAKSAKESVAWFSGKKAERREDPLLAYLHHARNSDEHGLERVSGTTTGASFDLGGHAGVVNIEGLAGGGVRTWVERDDGQFAPLTAIELPHITLLRVRDRGVTYDVPSEHLGSKIEDATPITVARLAVLYLESLLAEAAQLPPSHPPTS